MTGEGYVRNAIFSRRSLRRFAGRPVDSAAVLRLVEAACAAPAPHHSRPWRFVQVASVRARERLAEAMGRAWLADAERDGVPRSAMEERLRRSRERLLRAPLLLLACLSLSDTRPWPDERRRGAEREMFVQSLGAALQNMLLAAEEEGLVGYLKGAPLFCREAARAALELPEEWEPAFLVLLGYPEEGAAPAARPQIFAQGLVIER